ncbi:DUF3570 domain-containing protein [Pseudoalteromonas denitrificans]|uniref:DUF3570 domain-containing protein n=1 Tax=Pseudoalteromonas denitrificans TaxID=43656 RepID=UPI001FE5EA72|nr:DUF3570 domain-containing protein [Pseudoalteromonas denitrificans]
MVVINPVKNMNGEYMKVKYLIFTALFIVVFMTLSSNAAVLPEDRADAMYHSYQGGGMSIDGPSILLRKKIGKSVSVSTNYYIDMVSSASIDVLATASPYKEERKEHSLSVDYLHDKTVLSLGYSQSKESDFDAKSLHFDVSQDFFGDLTTLSFGFSKGNDEISQNGNETFKETATRANYRLGLSQVATKNLVLGMNLEAITDEGYLNNPYRSYRYQDANSATGFSYATEIYPNTRTSNAASLRARYFLPNKAAIYANARVFSDTWGIDANTYKLGYSQSFMNNWLMDFHLRHYSQTSADFYRDLFDRQDQFNFMARDKEMSTFNDLSIGLTTRYLFKISSAPWIKSSSINLSIDHIQFDYENFRNVLAEQQMGTEPFYSFSANVIRFYVSLWY